MDSGRRAAEVDGGDVAEVGQPTTRERTRALAIAKRIAERAMRKAGQAFCWSLIPERSPDWRSVRAEHWL